MDDSLSRELNELDARLGRGPESGDEAAFRRVLAEMLERVRAAGTPGSGGFV